MNDSDITVEPVITEAQHEQFLRLPWEIYRGDDFWVPPQIDFQREVLFEKTHAFNLNADCHSWLAVRQGQVVGRISAIVNHLHLQRHSDATGFFGFFECIDCPEVAACLFGAAATWLNQQSIRRVCGPVNPSIHYEAGMLMRPCEPFYTSTYNHGYYPALLDGCGFTRCHTMQSYCMKNELYDQLDPKIVRIAEQVAERFGIRLRHFGIDRFDEDMRTYFDLYNKTMSTKWCFTALPDEEIEQEISCFREIFIPELSVVAEVDGEPIGAGLGVLDYNSILRENDGQLFKHGKDRFLEDRARIKQSRMFSAHVVPQYERWGVGPAMMMLVAPAGLKLGIEFAETSWIEGTNEISKNTVLRAGGKPRAEYGFYEKSLA